MDIRILRPGRVLQDAGVPRPLSVGAVYTLATVVAQALIAVGDAEVVGAPELNPLVVPELKRGRR